MTLIKRDFFATPAVQTVVWDPNEGTFATRKRQKDGIFDRVSVKDPFVLDYHLAKHGYELWDGKDEARERKLLMASVSDDLPEQPDKTWKPLYTVPVWSAELNGMRELVLKGEAVTAAFADLFDSIEAKVQDLDETIVPIIAVSTGHTEFGVAPIFKIEEWMPRPEQWVKPIVRL